MSTNTESAVAQPDPVAPAISADRELAWLDLGVVGLVVALAGWYLYRKLWVRRGRCDGCAKGKRECAVSRQTAAARARNDGAQVEIPLDRIGKPKR